MSAAERSTAARAEEVFHAWLDEVQAGRDPDPDAVLAAQPADVRAELARILDDYRALRSTLGGLPAELEPGRELDGFRLVRELGRGAMGAIWEARDLALGRRVALKVLHAHLGLAEASLERFQREAAAGSKLSHPGIVAVYAVGEADGRPFIVQELVPGGRTLAHRLAELREHAELVPDYYRELAALVAAVADALEVAHRAGVIHRDVKPSNILITPDGVPKVADFGLARLQDEVDRSRSGEPLGTPFYMSPEQASGRRRAVDRRTDVFSLGATLYEGVTLRRPFEGDTSQQVFAKILGEDPPDPRRVRSRVPRELAIICTRALEKSPERRYATAAELAADLRRYLAREPIVARPVGPLGRALRRVRRHPARATAAVATALLAATIIGLGSYAAGVRRRAAAEHAGRVSAERELADRVVVQRLFDGWVDGLGASLAGAPFAAPPPSSPGGDRRDARIATTLAILAEWGLDLEGADAAEIAARLGAARERDPALAETLVEALADLVGLLDQELDREPEPRPARAEGGERAAGDAAADGRAALQREVAAAIEAVLGDPWRREAWRTARREAREGRALLPALLAAPELDARAPGDVLWLATLLLQSPPSLAELGAWGPVLERRLALAAEAEAVAPPDLVTAHLYLATLAYYAGDHEAVLDHLRVLRAMRPDSGLVQLLLAHEMGRAGELEEAERLVARLAERRPELAMRAYATLGDLRLARGEAAAALAAFERAAAAAPDAALPERLRGDALADLGRTAEAVGAYARSVELDPDQDAARANLWALHRARGDEAAALAVAEAAAERRPDSGWAHLGVGIGRLAAGDPAGAVAALERHAAQNPASPRAQRLLGDALRASGAPDRARAAYDRAVALHPGDLDAWAAWIDLALETGAMGEAAAIAARAREAAPASPWARLGAAVLGELAGAEPGAAEAAPAERGSGPLGGRWQTSRGVLVLRERDGAVAGLVRGAAGPRFLRGRRTGARVELDWAEVDRAGSGWLELDADGRRFAGAWRVEGTPAEEPWTGARP